MGLIKCPKHGLTYNDENPRGCPACAGEKRGRLSQSNMMQELARVSRRVEGQPEKGLDEPSWLNRLRNAVPTYDQRKVVRIGAIIIGALVAALFWLSRPRFIEQIVPATTEPSEVRTFPVSTGQDIAVVFAILGTRAPTTHPTSRSVQRYSYGSGLYVDAINGRVYSITIALPNRAWRGLRIGAGETEVEGTLALLGAINRVEDGVAPPLAVGGYEVYPSADSLPEKILSTTVRPPNGCFDVAVTVQPRTWGIREDGDRREVVVATSNRRLEWVATEIRVVDRAQEGPIARKAC